MITVAIPTANRGGFLRRTLPSILSQTGVTFDVVVVDNGSNDETATVVSGYRDSRLRYIRTEGLDVVACWNEAASQARHPFLSLFHDDDLMEPGFLAESCRALRQHPTAGFSFCRASCVDELANHLGPWYDGEVPQGLITGFDYVRLSVLAGRCLTIAPTVVFRTEMLPNSGPFGSPHSGNTFDFNLYLKIASTHDVAFIDRPLVRYTIHAGQMTEKHWRSGRETGRVGAMAELIDAVAILVRSDSARQDEFRQWVAGRLVDFNDRRSQNLKTL